MKRDRVVICMKWGTAFPPDYANVLFAAVSSYLEPGFRFVCLTDDPAGLSAGIVAAPIPDIGLSAEQIAAPGVWRKLALFHPAVAELFPGARALFIDLDMMILGSLDSFFSADTGIVLIDSGKGWQKGAPEEYSTATFAFTLGEQQQILQAFQVDPVGAMARFRNEQDFVAAHATDLTLWPSGAVISFKRHLVRRFGLDLFLSVRPPFTGPAILAFHGEPRPSDLMRGGIWGRFPHLGRGPVRWVQDYWTRYGAHQ